MTNPYTTEYLKSLIGQQESQHLEFKSSRGLAEESAQGRRRFISDQIVPIVSAFLNTDGGRLVIGVEDEGKDGVGTSLSAGVPKIFVSREQLQQMICDRIQPSVADHVSVHQILVGERPDGERLYAFVVEVSQGVTAYQAADKLYYVRRSGATEPMEDKDIRLRMLSGDKPRISIAIRPKHLRTTDLYRIETEEVYAIAWSLNVENCGVKTIPKAFFRYRVRGNNLPEETQVMYHGLMSEPKLDRYQGGPFRFFEQHNKKTEFYNAGFEENGLRPGEQYSIDLFSLTSGFLVGLEKPLSEVSLIVDIVTYIDDGLPAELRGYDLLKDIVRLPTVAGHWRFPVSTS